MANPRERLLILGSAVGALGVARCAYGINLEAIILDRQRGIACSTRKARHEIHTGPDAVIVNRLLSLARHDRATYLIATSDDWLRFIRRNRAVLASVLTNVLHPRDEILDICLQKSLFADWCESQGFLCPRTSEGAVREKVESLSFPVILRPNETLHEQGNVRLPKSIELHDPAALSHWLDVFERAKVGAVVSESLLGRRLIQFSVPFARHADLFQSYVAAKLRPDPKRCRVGTYVEARHCPRVEAFARKVIEALGYYGLGEVEILHDCDTDQTFLIEVNPRPWTQYSHSVALGFDFLGVVLGRPIRTNSKQASANLAWTDITNDLFEVFSRREGMLARRELTCHEYLRSLANIHASAKFQWSDPWPLVFDVFGMLQEKWKAMVRRRGGTSTPENPVRTDIRPATNSEGEAIPARKHLDSNYVRSA